MHFAGLPAIIVPVDLLLLVLIQKNIHVRQHHAPRITKRIQKIVDLLLRHHHRLIRIHILIQQPHVPVETPFHNPLCLQIRLRLRKLDRVDRPSPRHLVLRQRRNDNLPVQRTIRNGERRHRRKLCRRPVKVRIHLQKILRTGPRKRRPPAVRRRKIHTFPLPITERHRIVPAFKQLLLARRLLDEITPLRHINPRHTKLVDPLRKRRDNLIQMPEILVDPELLRKRGLRLINRTPRNRQPAFPRLPAARLRTLLLRFAQKLINKLIAPSILQRPLHHLRRRQPLPHMHITRILNIAHRVDIPEHIRPRLQRHQNRLIRALIRLRKLRLSVLLELLQHKPRRRCLDPQRRRQQLDRRRDNLRLIHRQIRPHQFQIRRRRLLHRPAVLLLEIILQDRHRRLIHRHPFHPQLRQPLPARKPHHPCRRPVQKPVCRPTLLVQIRAPHPPPRPQIPRLADPRPRLRVIIPRRRLERHIHPLRRLTQLRALDPHRRIRQENLRIRLPVEKRRNFVRPARILPPVARTTVPLAETGCPILVPLLHENIRLRRDLRQITLQLAQLIARNRQRPPIPSHILNRIIVLAHRPPRLSDC